MGTENSLAHTKWECKYHMKLNPLTCESIEHVR